MSNEQVKINVEPVDGELVLRTGKATENFKVRKPIQIVGTIGIALSQLSKKSTTMLEDEALSLESYIDESYLTVDRDAMIIEFVENAGKDYESVYSGKLTFDSDFEKFGINKAAVSYTPMKLAEMIKMNRSFFEQKTEAMRLVSVLMGFEAKVNKEVEAKDDGRANRRILRAQTVTTNIPEGFTMKLPIFKGQPSKSVAIEIGIDPNDLSCRLISPEVNDYIIETKNEIIDGQISEIQKLHPELRIFEL